MSEAEVRELFGTRLKETPWPGIFFVDMLEHYCGGDFEVQLNFFANPNKGLASVYLENRTGNPGGVIGNCVLDDITKKLGHPRTRKQIDGEEYSFGKQSSNLHTTLYTLTHRVVIIYEGRLPPGDY